MLRNCLEEDVCLYRPKQLQCTVYYLKNIVHSVIHIILFVIKNIYHPAVLILTVNSFNTFIIQNSIQLKR